MTEPTEDMEEPPKILKKKDPNAFYDGDQFHDYETVVVRARTEEEAKRVGKAVSEEFSEEA